MPPIRLQRRVIQVGLGVAVLGAAIWAVLPYARASTGNSSANIALSSTIRAFCSVAVVTDPQATDIDLSQTQSNLSIATVTESCNNANGYTVTVSSENGTTHGQPTMVGAALNGTMSYSVLYGGAPVSFNGGTGTALDTSTRSPTTRREVGIGFVGNPSLPSDSYADVLTFSIVGK